MTLNQKLDRLIDQWCKRRALRPLRCLLPVYSGAEAHTDQFARLLEGLRDVKGLCRNELTPDEIKLVVESINELEDFVKARLVA